METNLLSAVKYRLFDELTAAVQKNLVYKDKVKIYHKFPYREQPIIGVILKNVASSRVKLSPDDFAATLKSQFTLANVAQRAPDGSLDAKPGRFLDWVWEDTTKLVLHQQDEDLSSQITGAGAVGTTRLFQVAHTPITAGPNNTDTADNFRQIDVLVNGVVVHAEYVDGARGRFMLPVAPVPGQTLTVSYYYLNATPPGRYYIEITSATEFMVDPLYSVTKETVIEKTTGTELTASLAHGSLVSDLEYLYTIRGSNNYKFELEKGVDYSIDYTTGVVTFLQPLTVGVSLYADYRWIGTTLGPFTVPSDNHYNNTAITGCILAFSNEIVVGDKMVVLAFPKREVAASVYSGHFNLTVDIDVVARDPIQLPDLTDHILTEIWNNRRLELMNEGITITEFDPTGESEEPYDSNTGDLYYHNSLNMQVMTEWKKFVPYVTTLRDYDTKLYGYVTTHDYITTEQGKIYELRLLPLLKPFEVKYPKIGYARYM